MRRETALLVIILIVALGVRIYAPWESVLGGDYVNFLETDAWYHIRLIENQVRNWPWRATLDPFAAPGGQFIPIAPFFDTLTASVVRAIHGADAPVASIERVAAFVPPVLGTLAVAAVWGLGRAAFDSRAGLLAAALLAIAPGHFLDRTQLGFYDHHALEALLLLLTLWTLARAIDRSARGADAALAGIALGLYLLGWSSGALLVAVLGGWVVLFVLLARESADLARVARVAGIAAAVALVLVLMFQDPRMFRYDSQVFGLIALAGIAAAVHLIAGRLAVSLTSRTAASVGIAAVLAIAFGVLWASFSGVLAQLITDVGRLGADPRRMGVLEARPLFLYTGTWTWSQPWVFFRGVFYLGLAALVLFSVRVFLERRALDVLVLVTAAAMFVATYGQNRFGYYLVPMCALLAGWLGALALDWRRDLGAIAIAIGIFAVNITPGALLSAREGSLPVYWRSAMRWVGDNTEPPFTSMGDGAAGYYHARYPATAPPPDYSVMNWWDHGYWITQIARRVPVANPTQERAPNAARFYAATNERDALATLAAQRSRYVISDWELPFRYTSDGRIMGRFQNVVDWAGGRHDDYYEVMYRRAGGGWAPVWVFHEPYYRSMVFRMSVLGGVAATPAPNSTVVVVVADRVDATGMRFKEVLSEESHASYAAAVAAARLPQANGRALVVGLDPWRPAFPLERLSHLEQVHAARTPEQSASESPWVRVFRVVP